MVPRKEGDTGPFPMHLRRTRDFDASASNLSINGTRDYRALESKLCTCA